MCDLLGWIVFGGIAGWLASIITRRNERQGCLMNIIVGIVGAFIGGLAYSLIAGGSLDVGFALKPTSLLGFVVAVVGAVVLLVIVNLLTRRK
jgi:uncharacterized membrane protein YeaQ/YmgE (transglycosylase-associated protein family)